MRWSYTLAVVVCMLFPEGLCTKIQYYWQAKYASMASQAC
jgi:hypothetical protein